MSDSDLLTRLSNYIAQMAPHQKQREAGQLLIAARDELLGLYDELGRFDELKDKLRERDEKEPKV